VQTRHPVPASLRVLTLAFAGIALLAWPSPARASMSYPGDVDTALGVPGIVETKLAPTKGCQLCHTDPNGGTLTLTAFPNYLISQYDFPKTTVAEDGLVAASLAKLKVAEPKLWADMQAGIDPNTDPVLAEQAPPQPAYGCSIRAPRGGAGAGALVGLGLWSAAALVRRRRR
jgi:hypothetical protein